MPKMAADDVFIDTNILVFSSHQGSPNHGIAREILTTLHNTGTCLWISRQVLREYLVVMTRIDLLSGVFRCDDFIKDVKHFEQKFMIAEDGPSVTHLLLDLLHDFPTIGKQIHDANIVATMLSVGVRDLLTDNVVDFQRYSDLIQVHPLTVL